MKLKSIRMRAPRGKQVVYRADYNVPLKKSARGFAVANDMRIRRTLPSLKRLLESRNRIVILAHLGRPNGRRSKQYSLAPVARRLQSLLKHPVRFAADCVGSTTRGRVETLMAGDILLLENLRFHSGEKKADARFARTLASYGDVFVNDAFGNAHRADASMVGIPKYLPAYAGMLMEDEVKTLTNLLARPTRPFVGIIGGAKIKDKLSTIKSLMKKVDALLLGGALANTVLAAQGADVGKSFVDDAGLKNISSVQITDPRVHIPIDVVVARGKQRFTHVSRHAVADVPAQSAIYDIGPDTVELFRRVIRTAKSILWAGPMGMFEDRAFRTGTVNVARAVAQSNARSVIGGGDTLRAAATAGVLDRMSFVSTGGGAMLELLGGTRLPALHPLQQ